jgi:hypothetical protein
VIYLKGVAGSEVMSQISFAQIDQGVLDTLPLPSGTAVIALLFLES